jgi:hypothetical protein
VIVPVDSVVVVVVAPVSDAVVVEVLDVCALHTATINASAEVMLNNTLIMCFPFVFQSGERASFKPSHEQVRSCQRASRRYFGFGLRQPAGWVPGAFPTKHLNSFGLRYRSSLIKAMSRRSVRPAMRKSS